MGTVTRVGDLVALTGGFAELKAALEIVGREGSAPSQSDRRSGSTPGVSEKADRRRLSSDGQCAPYL